MAEPPSASPSAPAATVADRLAWLACAFPLSRLPVVGSEVYYFPHGHAEQCPAPLPAALASAHHLLFPCTVADVKLHADPKTDEPYAVISLVPGPHRVDAAPAPAPAAAEVHPDQAAEGPPDHGAAADASSFVYCGKQLTQSDANNGGGFSVPRFCADLVFPRLDFQADPPVQNLQMRDLHGDPWVFRHIYRGTPRRHLLTTGWTKFVNKKLLVAGDTVVFMRRPDGELLIGVRRVPRPQCHGAPAALNARARVAPEEVVKAAGKAREGRAFKVTYYPRQGAGEFVVPRREVEAAIRMEWTAGVQVRMKVVSPEDPRRSDSASGTVKTVHRSNIWRMLEVEWDDSSSLSWTKSRYVNAWQVQFVGCPPLLKTFMAPAPASCPATMQALELPLPAALSGSPASSEIVNPEAEAKGEDKNFTFEYQLKSIKLLGTRVFARVPVRVHADHTAPAPAPAPAATTTNPSVSSHSDPQRHLGTSLDDDQDDGASASKRRHSAGAQD